MFVVVIFSPGFPFICFLYYVPRPPGRPYAEPMSAGALDLGKGNSLVFTVFYVTFELERNFKDFDLCIFERQRFS